MKRVRHIARALRELGYRCGFKYYFADKVLSALGWGSSLYKLFPPQSTYPLYLRPGTSDRDVFRQVFIEGEYDIVPRDTNRVETVIDCGANVGITTVYLATIFPEAQLFAIEPDHDNFSVLRKNTRAFRDRVHCINSGVWSHQVGLKVERGNYRDGREWTTRVRAVTDGEEADLQATSIADVMQEYGLRSVDFLKIDIEGAEVALFDKGYEKWLPHVKSMAIELHGDESEEKLNSALLDVPASFSSAKFGETSLLIQD